jgi:hypothetical protein
VASLLARRSVPAGAGGAAAEAAEPEPHEAVLAEIGVRPAIRASLTDFYFNSWRLAPANVLWALTLLLVAGGALVWLPLALALPVLGLPTVGLYRIAGRIVRGEAAAFGDLLAGVRERGRSALVVAAGAFLLGTTFTTNVILGREAGGPAGWLFSVLALDADIILVAFLVVGWPLLADPRRADLGLGRLARLAVLVALARPGRILALTVLVAAVLVLSTILLAALVMVAVAFVALVTTRVVLPIADRLEPPPG